MNLIDHLQATANDAYENEITFFDGAVTTVTNLVALHQRARAVAGGMQARGIGPGDVVAVQMPNRFETAVAYQAVLLTGATLLPVVHIYGPREVDFVLRESGARMLVMADSWRSIDYTARVPALSRPGLEIVIVGAPATGTTDWASLSGPGYRAPQTPASYVAVLSYTSGTTSAPKGAQHTAAGILAEVTSQAGMVGYAADTVQLASFPFGHVAGLLSILRPMLLGTPTVVLDGWDPAVAIDRISRYGVTSTSGTPLHLATLLDALEAGAPLTTMREYLVGAATVPAALIARADALGIRAFRCYGSTEHPTISSGTPHDALAKRQFTDGRPTPGTTIRVVGPDGLDVATGVDGEVICRGPETFIGYRDPSLDEDTWLIDPAGERWLRTGDIGNLDADGYLTITDRAKDVIIRAGETISSREVEDVLLTCPGVADAAVIAVPDEYYGEKVGAVIVPTPGSSPTLESVRLHFASSGLAKQKTPEYVELRSELPRTPIGKVRKADLRDELRERLLAAAQ